MIDILGLEKKHILITGASSGIGRETAKLLSHSGAILSMVSRRKDALLETLSEMTNTNDAHRYYSFDLSETNRIEELVSQIVKDNGPIDGFIHCAGVGINLPVSMTKTNAIETIMKTNFYSFAELIRVLSKKKNSNSYASFVGVSSIASLQGDKTQGVYAASKAAMNAYIHPAAKELSNRGIRLNTIAFGMIKTAAYDRFIESGGLDSALSKQYLGYGLPEDAARVLAFMVSSASKLITGTTLICDCGYSS